MKKFLFIGLFLGWSFFSVFAQLSFPGSPISFQTENLSMYIPTVDLPIIDNQKLLQEDNATYTKGQALRVGVNHNVSLNMNNSGRWDILPNGDRIWRMAVKSIDAASLHFNFETFVIPQGAEVYIYSPDHQVVEGKYDARSALENGDFYTPDIPGDEMIVEYYQPAYVEGKPEISIHQVGHIYQIGRASCRERV